MIQKIGNVKFWADTNSPTDAEECDVSFTSMCYGNENLALVIDLGTKDDALAIERGRRIVQLWQLAEAFTTEAEPTFTMHVGNQHVAGIPLFRLFDMFNGRLGELWKAVKEYVGRGREPDPSRQPGPVSQTPMRSDMQGKRHR